MPLVIAVTGSIATGKSYLARYLVERYGAAHADVDRITHRMYDPGTPGFDRVVEAFGPEVIGEDGYINRRAVGRLIFGSRERTIALRNAVEGYELEVKAVIDGWRRDLPESQFAVFEAFNLVEGGFGAWCDVSWIVRADDEIALPRILARNVLTEDEARARLAAARSWELRIHACDRVFDNNGAAAAFEAAIDAALSETLAAYRAGTLPPSRARQSPPRTAVAQD